MIRGLTPFSSLSLFFIQKTFFTITHAMFYYKNKDPFHYFCVA